MLTSFSKSASIAERDIAMTPEPRFVGQDSLHHVHVATLHINYYLVVVRIYLLYRLV